MARPLRVEYPGAFYHVTSRGNDRKDVFRSGKDRKRFLAYLASATARYGARVHVYCLMSNHYHLLVETPRGNLSQIMAHINGAYTTYFNLKRQRAGHLFQGRYKSILVEQEAYAEELSLYLHLNPVRAKMVGSPEDFPWSSYRAYAGMSAAPTWLVREMILAHFGSNEPQAPQRYREFVEGAIGRQIPDPFASVVASTVLGSSCFVDWVQEEFLDKKTADRELPALRVISNHPSIEAIRQAVECSLGRDPAAVRRVALYLCHQYCGRRLKEIGVHFGVTESAVTQASRRMAESLQENEPLRQAVAELQQALDVSNVY